MAHYAFLDANNIVTQVIVGVNENELIEGKTPEQWYGEFKNQTCKRTSYNTIANKYEGNGIPFRGNFAGIGFKYDENFDVFIPPQPYSNWILNYTTFSWEPPIARPADIEGYVWRWSEPNQEWVKIPTTQE
jgi:hypothetical protein